MPASVREQIQQIAQQRILVIDGAMGTMIQKLGFGEKEYRGTQFADWKQDVKGNNDMLVLTQPDAIQDIHAAYLAAGADILETNTFSSTTIAMADYGMEGFVDELNLAAARLAREAADAAATPEKPRFVAGAMGPTNRTCSLSPDVNNPGFRNTDFDQMQAAYKQQARALVQGGVDFLLIETIFDTLNAKAAIHAVMELADELGRDVPMMISGTITDRSGRNLSGQTVEGFWHSVRHAKPLAVGLNCAFGADLMRPYIADLARVVDTLVISYPNAGLPNAFGQYDEPPEETARQLGEWAMDGLINIVGGCCGTTPDHIRAIAEKVAQQAPRKVHPQPVVMRLSGLEAVTIAA